MRERQRYANRERQRYANRERQRYANRETECDANEDERKLLGRCDEEVRNIIQKNRLAQ